MQRFDEWQAAGADPPECPGCALILDSQPADLESTVQECAECDSEWRWTVDGDYWVLQP